MTLSERWHRWSDAVWERVLGVGWVRRVVAVGIALATALFPIYAAWLVFVRRASAFELVDLVWSGVFFVVTLGLLAFAGLPAIDRSPVLALVGVVPVVGVPFLVWWSWELVGLWRPKAQRETERADMVEGLSVFDREVFRLRFDVEAGLHVSRRRAAKQLGVGKEQIAAADERIRRHIATA